MQLLIYLWFIFQGSAWCHSEGEWRAEGIRQPPSPPVHPVLSVTTPGAGQSQGRGQGGASETSGAAGGWPEYGAGAGRHHHQSSVLFSHSDVGCLVGVAFLICLCVFIS